LTTAELVMVPRLILWAGALATTLVGVAARKPWPASIRSLRQTALPVALWAIFLVGSLELGLYFADETVSFLWVGFGGVLLVLATVFLCGAGGAPHLVWGWAVLWFVSVIGHVYLTGAAGDLRAITSVDGRQERTLEAFEADPGLGASHLTNAVCRVNVKVKWSEQSGGKNKSTSHYTAVPVISPNWQIGMPVRTWVLDGHTRCARDGPVRSATILVRERAVPDRMRDALSSKLDVPSDAVLARIPSSEPILQGEVHLGAWILCGVLALSVGWWLIGTPLLLQPIHAPRRPVRAQWLHDGVVLDLGPVLSARANLVRPLAYALGTGTAVLVGGIVLMCISGCIGESSGWWDLQTKTYSWVTFGGILPVSALVAAAVALWRQRSHQELHISTLHMRLLQRSGGVRTEVWEVPIHEITACAWLPPPEQDLRITRTSGSPLLVHLPHPLEDDLDLGAMVSETVTAARASRGEAWEVPSTLRDLLTQAPVHGDGPKDSQ